MKDWIRTIFSIRQKRRAPRAGPVPPEGALILRGEVRMAVDRAIPSELWGWMLLSGWRTLPVKVDRRQHKLTPAGALKALIEAPASERDAVHTRILARASAPKR